MRFPLILLSAAGLLWSQARTPLPASKAISEADCTAQKLGAAIPASAIGEPVSAVTLSAPSWNAAPDMATAYCSVDGSLSPVDTAATARPIHFRVVLPASWSYRAAQLGGGGMNGSVPDLLANPGPRSALALLPRGFATYGSDSGHEGGGRGRAAPGSNDWTLNDEAIANLGYMQLKKTHDAAMVLIERMYGARPRFNYFFGTSQGGREALTVAQRYPADYDGIAANVPIVNFSSLMLGPELIRIQEKPAANWVTMAKVNAIRGEIMRQCDKLDGLVDGIVNNYMDCRAIFDVKQGALNRDPWAAKRCPNNIDPNPADTSAAACLTDGQISTLQMVYSRYLFATPLANGVKSFGMWLPGTDPAGSGLIAPVRFRGQEGAADDAPVHTHLGVLGVTGFLFRDLNANPLDYVEGGSLNARREKLSAVLDSTNPDLSAFSARGGKLLAVIGTNDTLASPGSQLDYYQAVIDKLGQAKVDSFARLFVLPQTTHGLSGSAYTTDGEGKSIPASPIPNTYDRVGVLMDWVENNKAPGKQITVTSGERSLPMCSYPAYPKYTSGPADAAGSYSCAAPHAPAAPPRRGFEVASVKPNQSGPPTGPRGIPISFQPGGEFTAMNVTLVDVLVQVYGTRRIQLRGGPDWIDSERFDIVAKPDAADGPVTNEEKLPMVQMLLEDRFKLRLHRETKDMPVLALVGALSPALKESKDGVLTFVNGEGGRTTFQHVPMSGLVNMTANVLHTPVIDGTGIQGYYDFSLDPARYADNGTVTAMNYADLFETALREQLGFKLERRKAPLEITVIDSASRPAGN